MEVMDKAGTDEFQKRLGRVEELIAALEAAPDVAVREQVRELIQTLLDLHGTGLERLLSVVYDSSGGGSTVIDELSHDQLVSGLLLLHGLHPLDLETRVRNALDEGLAQAKGLPLLTVSGVTGRGVDQLLQVAHETRDSWSKRVSTGILNRWFEKAIEANPPPAPGGRRIKLRYMTQAKTRPPGFILFGTRVDQLPESYRRYLINGIKRDLGFGAVPVRLTLRAPKNPFD